MNANSIKRCSFEQWYTPLRSETIRGYSIPLPPDFVQFLLQDEFILPEGVPSPFPELEARVTEILNDELDGMAFPKLNFTAPTDAAFMGLNRSIVVKSFRDLLLLLKGSTRVMLDLTQPFGEQVEDLQPVLVLKRWFNYRQEREFRAFIKDKSTYCITSRYPHLASTIFSQKLQNLFPPFLNRISQSYNVEKLIIDFYVSPKERLHIVDLAPWNEITSPGLFTWEEIENINDIEIKVSDKDQIVPPDDSSVPVELQGAATLDEIIASMKQLDDIDESQIPEFAQTNSDDE